MQAAQEKLLAEQSKAARGDVDRIPADSMNLDTFSRAVRNFIGTCATMPTMQRKFSTMREDELAEYEDLLQSMETWCRGVRNAMNTLEV